MIEFIRSQSKRWLISPFSFFKTNALDLGGQAAFYNPLAEKFEQVAAERPQNSKAVFFENEDVCILSELYIVALRVDRILSQSNINDTASCCSTNPSISERLFTRTHLRYQPPQSRLPGQLCLSITRLPM